LENTGHRDKNPKEIIPIYIALYIKHMLKAENGRTLLSQGKENFTVTYKPTSIGGNGNI
jgi:hypothetical protein